MLTFSFFGTVFISILWLIYISIYLSIRLAGVDLTTLGLIDTALYVAIVFVPLSVLWSIWGRFYNLSHEKKLQKQLQLLSTQMTQSQEYSDVIARILLKSNQQQVHAFALSKVDLYISEMNEILSDVLQRYEFLDKTYYSTVIRTVAQGNRWGFAKAVVDLYNKDPDFEKKLTKSAISHRLLAGSITEFCANYTRLLRLLKSHDEDNILQEIIETGALGKVFAVFASIVRNLHEPEIEKDVTEIRNYRDEGPELRDDERFFKDDRILIDNDENMDAQEEISSLRKRPTIFRKIVNRVLRSKKEEDDEREKPDAFTMALERSFSDKGLLDNVPTFLSRSEREDSIEPVAPNLSEEENTKGFVGNFEIQTPRFNFDSTNKTIKSLQKEWEDMKKNDFISIVQDKAADE